MGKRLKEQKIGRLTDPLAERDAGEKKRRTWATGSAILKWSRSIAKKERRHPRGTASSGSAV